MKFPRRATVPLAAFALAAQLAAQPSPENKTVSPVETFRKLLAMPAPDRKNFLASRDADSQRRILAKLREYDSLRPDERELRLRATELEFFLTPLLSAPAPERAARLAQIPDEPRRAIEPRLREWDKLPAAAQSELLSNAATLRYFAQLQSGTPEEKKILLAGITPARREKLEAGVADWQGQPPAQREKLLARFNQFFDLTPDEKARALGQLTDAEREQMARTLAKFERLPKAQRDVCVQSFAKFAAMSLADRQEFLQNAERWRLMSPGERQQWREVVQRLAPPPMPPMPPGFVPTPPSPPGLFVPLATNRN